jgi:hypothetical protein
LPDGQRVAYLANRQSIRVLRLSDATVTDVTKDFSAVYRSVWSPDGERLLFYGADRSEPFKLEFWVVPKEGGIPIKSALATALSMQIRTGPEPRLPILFGWQRSGVYL